MKDICLRRRLLFVFSLMILIIASSTIISYAGISNNATGQVNSSDGVIVRSSYSTSSNMVTVLNDNTKVNIISETFTSKSSTAKVDKWYRITCGDYKGYIRADLIDNLVYKKAYGKTTASVNFRKGPNADYVKISKISTCTNVTVYLKAKLKNGETWYKIKKDGTFGYVNSKYICAKGTSSYDYAIGTVNVNYTYLRKSYSGDSEEVCKVNKDAKMVLLYQVYSDLKNISAKTKWYKVRYKDQTGYVRGDKLNVLFYPRDYHTTGNVYIRKGPDKYTDSVYLMPKDKNVKIYIKTIRPGGKAFYKVLYKGYYRNICAAYVVPGKIVESNNDKIEDIYKKELAKFPESYQTLLKKLHEDHPNWVFKAKTLDYSWNNAIDRQFARHSTNLVPNSFPAAKKAIFEDTYNFNKHTYIGYDGASWVCASLKCLKFYMDPRNWLNNLGIFMFESIKYDPAVHTKAAVESILEMTGVPVSKSEYYIEAAQKYGISPVYLASKTRMELGSGDGKGVSGGVTVYNVFNIGASDSASGGAQNGYNYAKSKGWTTYKKAIIEGAQFIASGFMDNNQYTLYYERFNILNGLSQIGTHQYCTNTVNPATMANVNYWEYKDNKLVNSAFTFEIPVYKNMPANKCTEPLSGNNNRFLDALAVKNDDKVYTIRNTDVQKYGIVNSEDGVNVRKEASAKSIKLGTLDYKETVTIVSSTKDPNGDKWYKVKSVYGTGYVKATYLNESYFNRFVNKYNVEVPNEVTSLKISYTRNLTTSTVSITGNTNLKVGSNTIKVKVTSSSGIANTYYIYVTRKEAVKTASKIQAFSTLSLDEEPEDEGDLYTEVENSISETEVDLNGEESEKKQVEPEIIAKVAELNKPEGLTVVSKQDIIDEYGEFEYNDYSEELDSEEETSDYEQDIEEFKEIDNDVTTVEGDKYVDNIGIADGLGEPNSEGGIDYIMDETLDNDNSGNNLSEDIQIDSSDDSNAIQEDSDGDYIDAIENEEADEHFLNWNSCENATGYIVYYKTIEETEYTIVKVNKSFLKLERFEKENIYQIYVKAFELIDDDILYSLPSLEINLQNDVLIDPKEELEILGN